MSPPRSDVRAPRADRHVARRLCFEPVRDRAMDCRRVGAVASARRRVADQVWANLRDAADLDDEPAQHELGGRPGRPLGGPSRQALELHRLDRPSKDREHPQERAGVCADARPHARRRRRRCRPRGGGPGPARRARTAIRRPFPQPRGLLGPDPRLRLATNRTPAARSSGRTDNVRGADPSSIAVGQGRREAVRDGRRPRRDHEREATPRAGRRPHEVVTERDGHGIDPLQVVHEQGGGTEPGDLAVDRLEDPDRVEATDIRVGIEQAEEGPISLAAASRRRSGEAAASGTLDSGS